MAFMTCIGTCYCCGATFSFNPNLVPSLPAHMTRTREKEPVCRSCIESANPDRIAKGLDPIVILPGAYEGEEVP